MASSWQPVRMQRIEFADVHPRDKGLVVLRVVLDRRPSANWRRFFIHAFRTSPARANMLQPVFDGSAIVVTPPDARVEAEVAIVMEGIGEANARHAALLAVEPPTNRIGAETQEAGQAGKRTAASLGFEVPMAFKDGRPSELGSEITR